MKARISVWLSLVATILVLKVTGSDSQVGRQDTATDTRQAAGADDDDDLGTGKIGTAMVEYERSEFRPIKFSKSLKMRTPSGQGAYHVWSDEKKYYGCLMPKIGCTSWLTYLRTMHVPLHLHPKSVYSRKSFEKFGLHFGLMYSRTDTLGRLPVSSQKQMLEYMGRDAKKFREIANSKEFFKFAVVRDPWERLQSGYRNKWQLQCKEDRNCMAKNFQIPYSPGPLSFHDFVIALAATPLANINAHFRPQYILCDLLHIKYDFLADLRNPDHTDYLSQKIGFDKTFNEVTESRANKDEKIHARLGHGTALRCTIATVDAAERLFATDALLLGTSFAKAYDSCWRFGTAEPPAEDSL